MIKGKETSGLCQYASWHASLQGQETMENIGNGGNYQLYAAS